MYWHGGRCVEVLHSLIGIPLDPKKSCDDLTRMVVIGSEVMLNWLDKQLHTRLNPLKADRWSRIVLEIISTCHLPADEALKMAGRLSSAVTSAHDRIGRAFIKPFYAQAFDPLPSASPLLVSAAGWWYKFLAVAPPKTWHALTLVRPLRWVWTDAAGPTRWIAAVQLCLQGTQATWSYTAMVLPLHIWEQLLDRRDHQIAYQEFVAILLAVESFVLSQCLVFMFIDNDSVLYSVVKGRGSNPEVNIGIGRLWMEFASRHVAPQFVRVESKANLADGPTRNNFVHLETLDAVFVKPQLIPWTYDVWSFGSPLS